MIESYLSGRVDHYSNQVGQMIGSARSAKYKLQAIVDVFNDLVPEYLADRFNQHMHEAIGLIDDIIATGNEMDE